MAETTRTEWIQLPVDNVSYDVRIDWYGKSGYVTPHRSGIPLGLPMPCRSVEHAKSLSKERVRDFLRTATDVYYNPR